MAHEVQITGTYATGIGPTYTHIIKKLLEHANPVMPLHQFVQKRFIPLNSGKTAQFTRLLHIAAGAKLTEGAEDSAVKVYSQDFTVSVDEWGKAIACSTLLDDTFITPALMAHVELLGESAGRTMQLELQKTLWGEDYDETTLTYEANTGCIGLTWSATAATVQKLNHNIASDSTGTTATYTDHANIANAYAQNDDTFLGGGIVFTNPEDPNYGLGRRVFDYASATGIITWKTVVNVLTSSLDGTNQVTDPARWSTARVNSLSSATTLALTQGTDILSTGALRRAVGILRKESAPPFTEPYYACVVGPDEYHNLVNSSSTGDFIDIHKYTNIGPLLTNEVGNICGCRVVMDNRPYRLAITSPFDYSATGGLHMTFVLGKNCLGACGLQGQLGLGKSDTTVIIKRPGPQTVSDPLNKRGTAGWKTVFGRLSLNACNGVGIITYPYSL